jgi:protein-S-isoprenylcysteine O-methyltransferase Ste14
MGALRATAVVWVLWFAYWTIAARGASEARWKEGWIGRAQHLTPIGVGLFFIYGHPSWFGERILPEFLGWPGFALVLAGFGFAIWARVHLGAYWSGTISLKIRHRVVKTGPYAKIRHPIYTGILTATLGAAIAQGGWAGVAGLAMLALAFAVKLKREEKVLLEQFGEEYQDYKRQSRALIPGIW